jgi:hypothetical protein
VGGRRTPGGRFRRYAANLQLQCSQPAALRSVRPTPLSRSRVFYSSSSLSRALLAWLISHQPAVLFSHNKPATSNQPAVLFSQNKSAPVMSRQPTEQAAGSPRVIRLVKLLFGTATVTVRCRRRSSDRGPPADDLPARFSSRTSNLESAACSRDDGAIRPRGKISSWRRARHLLVGGPCDRDVISIVLTSYWFVRHQ